MSKAEMKKRMERLMGEVDQFVREHKPAKERIDFKRKQLTFLKGGVKKKMLPFKEGLAKIEMKKQRRKENVQLKQALEQHRKKSKK